MALICALLLHWANGGALEALAKPETLSMLLFLETGKVVRFGKNDTPEKEDISDDQPAVAVFSAEDADLVEVKNVSGKTANVEVLMQKPLAWNLKQSAPTVLILHSHGTESYENTENYEASGYYRTENAACNMVSVGAELAKILEAGGVSVIHDTAMHDAADYNNSYNAARKSIKKYLEKYPTISLVLDLHRDAARDSDGQQVKFTTKVNGETAARLMLVVGTDSRLSHPKWPENMALAVKLHALLEKKYPGICRPISFRSQRFNQDLSTGALLIEVGAAGNTRQEALAAARLLGQTILEMSGGATVNSTK